MMKRIYIISLFTIFILSLLPAKVYCYPSDATKQKIQEMINRGDPLRGTYEQAVKKVVEVAKKWDDAGRPVSGPIINEARARLNDKKNAKGPLQANRDSIIHAVDSVFDTGIPAGADIKYDPECKVRGYNSEKCPIRICEPGISGGPDRLAGTKIHEWEHQKQKQDSLWGPGNVPPDTSFKRAQLEFDADEAILNADNGNKIKLTIEQKMEILNRKLGNLKHMLDALEAEWKARSMGALPGGEVREAITVTNHSDIPQMIHCTIQDSLGWEITPNMFAVFLSPEQETIIKVDVLVPPMTEIGTINELFCYAEGLTHSSFDFTMINVVPSVDVVACADTHGVRGQILDLTFTITNMGEEPDTFHVEVTNPLDWPAESFFDVFLDIHGDTSFTVPITIPISTPFWTTNLISCEARSLSDPTQYDKEWTAIRVDEVDVHPLCITSPVGTYISGSIVTPKVVAHNSGYVESFFDIFVEIDVIPPYKESIEAHLGPNEIIETEMLQLNLTGPGIYNIKTYSVVAGGDANPYNDTLTGQFVVEPMAFSAWTPKESLPNFIKDGGALTTVPGEKSGDLLYALRGSKSNEFYMYDAGWTPKESLLFGYKWPLADPPKLYKKFPGKGAALCYDGENTIYATKGNGTHEFWAYDITANTWTAKAFVPSEKGLKGGTSLGIFGPGSDPFEGQVCLLAGGQKKDAVTNFFVYNPPEDTVGGSPWTTLTGAPLTPPATGKPKPFKDGSAISVIDNTIYTIKGGDKYNFFYTYDIAGDTALGTPWTEMESIPRVHPVLGKKNKVGDGGAMTTDGSILYVIKGKGKQDFWSYSPISKGVWTPLDTIPRVGMAFKKSVPKTGAALAYANDAVWLLKGNKKSEFWCYTPSPGLSARTNSTSLSSIMTENNMPFIKFSLDVRPNPFTKHTTIRYTVPISGKVTLKLYNVTGRLIETFNDNYLNAGVYTTTLSTKTLAKGIYFLRYNDNTNQKDLKLIVQ
jgi:hypothetical protein